MADLKQLYSNGILIVPTVDSNVIKISDDNKNTYPNGIVVHVCTQSLYDAIETKLDNVLYIIT